MTTPWSPLEKPWRVLRKIRSSNPLHYGWLSSSICFATEEEARENLRVVGSAGVLHYAENAATWNRNGYWRRVK